MPDSERAVRRGLVAPQVPYAQQAGAPAVSLSPRQITDLVDAHDTVTALRRDIATMSSSWRPSRTTCRSTLRSSRRRPPSALSLRQASSVAAALWMTATGPRAVLLPAGLAGLLHDAGNLALTQLAAAPADPATTAAAATQRRVPAGLRRAGLLAATSGLAAAVLPWTTGTAGPSAAVEQLGYLPHLPVMIWFCVLGVRRPG